MRRSYLGRRAHEVARADGWYGDEALRQDVAAVQPSPEPTIARVHHPVISQRNDRWYRVIRIYATRDGQQIEDIGSCPQMADALRIARGEIGRARVLAPFIGGNGKQIADNLQPIEVRA